ncbi:hypothetical protein AYI69_g4588 [Smittium culicis]|uniref:Uncharacterized protein n=1 Tax=Smittium culicis TaxID=133412 RepID=A0A1R1YCC4_9FUNG|nr:hypothetical protein AYI69_g4588 [Smittium culicis]
MSAATQQIRLSKPRFARYSTQAPGSAQTPGCNRARARTAHISAPLPNGRISGPTLFRHRRRTLSPATAPLYRATDRRIRLPHQQRRPARHFWSAARTAARTNGPQPY